MRKPSQILAPMALIALMGGSLTGCVETIVGGAATVGLAAAQEVDMPLQKKRLPRGLQAEEMEEQVQSLRCINQLKQTFSRIVDFHSLTEIYKSGEPIKENELILSSVTVS